MNDHTELERLQQRQQALRERLQTLEHRLQGEIDRLDQTRRDLLDLQRHNQDLQAQEQLLAQDIASTQQHPAAPAQTLERAPSEPPPLPPEVVPPPVLVSTAAGAEAPVVGSFETPCAVPPAEPVPEQTIEPGLEAAVGQEWGARGAPAPNGSFEMRLGTYWLVRIGIVVLLTGMVFLANLAYRNFIVKMGPEGKVVLLYLLSFGLLGVGAWLHRRQEALRNYARVLVAGGLAAVYFTTYAAHHVPNLRVIASPVWDGALLLVWAGFMVWLADRAKSEVLALFATGLGYYTSVITQVGFFTLYSNLVLTLASVFFLVRNRWALLSSVSLAATYLAYSFWRFAHGGEWRWASPEEGLWKGIYFLMSYWTVFCAATFLAENEPLKGKARATFATLNNGAFFGLVLLTMLQVGAGFVWKFSLGYGAALLALAWLAAAKRSGERIFSQAYLTQGLLLVTLGFVLYFSGLKLALVLAAQSVVLTVLGRRLDNLVMRVGALVSGGLATGWTAATLETFDRTGLITGAVIGAMMLFNAQWEGRGEAGAKRGSLVFPALFTGFTLLAWLLTTWQNVEPRWLSVAYAAESAILFLASGPLRNHVLGYGAFALAALGVTIAATGLVEEMDIEFGQRQDAWPGTLTGGLVLFNAWWARRRPEGRAAQRLDAVTTFFAGFGLLAWLLTTWTYVPTEVLAVVLAVEAVVLTTGGLVTGVLEVGALAQVFAVLAQLHCLAHLLPRELAAEMVGMARLPWWNPVVVLGVSLALSHGWQRWKVPGFLSGARQTLQAVYGFAGVFVLWFWLRPHFAPGDWLAMICLLALVVTAYGAVTRLWWLAGGAQILLVTGIVEFARQVMFGLGAARPTWLHALAPMVAPLVLPTLAAKWLATKPPIQPDAEEQVRSAGTVYVVLAGLLAVAWIFEYVPVRDRFWTLVVVGGGTFVWSGFRRSLGWLVASGAFTAIGLLVFWWEGLALLGGGAAGSTIVYVPNLLAILFVMAQQQVAKHQTVRFAVPAPAHNGAMVLGGCSLWLLSSRWVLLQGSGFYLTAGWAALALIVFTVGFILRERMYRWLGLIVLGCALGRVVVYDVWKLETTARILSFMALGIVLLVLGFIYNKFQDKIREWL